MNQPTISIVVSTYNRPERLKKAIESVQKQTFTNWELIVVHDEKRLMDLLMKTSDMRVKEVGLDEHFGCDTKPKNQGIRLATAPFIAFLDDDNEWRPDHLAALHKELSSHPEVAMVYGDRWIVDESGQIPPQMGISSEYNPGLLMQRNYIDTSDVLIRREALEDVGGFDERYRKYVDWNLWVRLCKAGYNFRHVPLILTDYHLHETSKSFRPEDERAPLVPAWDPLECEIQVGHLGKIRQPRVAVFSLTYDRLEYSKACFASLHKTAGYPFDHFVVDNGSTDGTTEYLAQCREQGNIAWVQYNKRNAGISKASNQALNEIVTRGYDIIMKVDNDCLFLNQGWLKVMVEIWKRNRRLVLSPAIQGLKDNPGGAPREVYGMINGEQIGMTRHLGGICVFADASAYKDFRWDDNDFLHGVQDMEFSQAVQYAGFQMGYLENWFAEHYEGTDGQHKRFPEYFERRKGEKTTRYAKD